MHILMRWMYLFIFILNLGRILDSTTSKVSSMLFLRVSCLVFVFITAENTASRKSIIQNAEVC